MGFSQRDNMAATRDHRYAVSLNWSGNLGSGTSAYRDYSRNYDISAEGKPVIYGSADPVFWGDRSRWNPEELLVASLSAATNSGISTSPPKPGLS
jgi:organic hydroperoxide reductase OsmC/OhrA